MKKLFILLVCVFKYTLTLKGDFELKQLGEKEYLLLKAKSNLPVHGPCWHESLKQLKSNCDKLNDHEHSILALRLANCFLEDSGHVTYDCYLSETESDRRKCINNMSDRAFGVYNEFYTHTIHICFYLNHELWQIETEKTFQNLYAASSKMTEQLVEASKMQGSMLESQKEGLKLQNELLVNGKELGTVIQTSADSVNTMVLDFKESSRNQQALLNEIFSYMRAFQDWIVGEVSWFQSIVYYTIACIICALFSSSKRTVDARITLFVLLSLNVTVERMLVQYNINVMSPEDKIQLAYYTWGLRKIVLLLCVSILLYSYYSYRDEYMENHKVLRRIEKKLHSLQEPPQPFRYRTRLAVKRLNESKVIETKPLAKCLDEITT
ncbi:uncharacterized protein LOC103580740 [Microplitis demolitor]|uniref:uncharacterized protein LOC103580740 n=1 Tax=Microplitis demolitor TaxID=69319 RepID=UPI0004CD2533|nr:uncharacterized protein LOC103580740 [Microplitis demolitor]